MRIITVAVLLAAALVGAGCSGTVAPSPSVASGPSSGASSPAAPASPVPTVVLKSFLIPFDEALLAVMPSTIGDATCQNEAYNLGELMRQGPPYSESLAIYQAFASAVGVSLDKLSLGGATCPLIVNGSGYTAVYEAVRAVGGDSSKLLAGFLALAQAEDTPLSSPSPKTVGGRTVQMVSVSNEKIAYLYQSGPVLFFYPSVRADVDDLVISALP